MQIDSASVQSGNQYSVTELVQQQQCTAVMPTPYATSLLSCHGLSQANQSPARSGLTQAGLGWTVAGFGPGQARQADPWLGPAGVFQPKHISSHDHSARSAPANKHSRLRGQQPTL